MPTTRARRPPQLLRTLAVFTAFVLLTAGVGHGTLFRHGRLIAFEPIEDPEASEACLMPAEAQREAMRAIAASEAAQSGNAAGTAIKDYIRRIRDPYPAFAAISVDVARNEVVVTDENTFKILVYDRLENTPAGAEASKPKRTITGDKTDIEFQSGVYVDPKSGEIFAANNDTRDTFVVFAAGADGDVAPIRGTKTPHGTFGVAVDEVHGEAIFSVQHDSGVVSYRRNANGDESPIRMMQGDKTGLADPHGIALDARDDVLFIANFGSTHRVDAKIPPRPGVPSAGNEEGKQNWPLGRERSVPGSGTISEPSIIVHSRTATGNVPPMRVIKGPKTQLNWPTGVAFDPEAREIFVANDASMSVLVFDAAAAGDIAPKRVIKGPKTQLANPTGIFADTKNRELWVTNFGGHSATVYDLAARGDVAPKRTIRSAPNDAPSLMIGNPGAIGLDTKRDTLLVPN